MIMPPSKTIIFCRKLKLWLVIRCPELQGMRQKIPCSKLTTICAGDQGRRKMTRNQGNQSRQFSWSCRKKVGRLYMTRKNNPKCPFLNKLTCGRSSPSRSGSAEEKKTGHFDSGQGRSTRCMHIRSSGKLCESFSLPRGKWWARYTHLRHLPCQPLAAQPGTVTVSSPYTLLQ